MALAIQQGQPNRLWAVLLYEPLRPTSQMSEQLDYGFFICRTSCNSSTSLFTFTIQVAGNE